MRFTAPRATFAIRRLVFARLPRRAAGSIATAITAGLVTLAILLPAPASADGALTDIDFMPIGNSITHGEGYIPGFRDDLHALLAAEPIHSFTWVGDTGSTPLLGHFQGGREIEDFYPSSFGNGWGNGTFDTTPALGPPGTPNLVAIHVGTNDLNSQPPPYTPYSIDHGQTLNPSQPAELAEYLLYLLQWQDGTNAVDLQHIVLSLIIPMLGRDQDVADFNNSIIAMTEDFAESTVSGDPIRIAIADHFNHFLSNPDLFSFGPGDWMEDALHPNEPGYIEMAAVYHAAVMAAVDDNYPPDPVTDLAVASVDSTRVFLTFTATGDDGPAGQALRYDLRIATYAIDALNFPLTTQVIGEPGPGPAGTTETIEVSGLLPGNTYHFALKVVDDGGNRSDISSPPVSVSTTGTQTVTLTLREGLNGYFGTEDNSMIDMRPQDNFGGANAVHIGRYSSSGVAAGVAGDASAGDASAGNALITDIRRALIRFDISQVPTGATILDAKLRAYHYTGEGTAPVDVAVYRLTKHWEEGTQTPPDIEPGAASWNSARHGSLDWSSPGAGAGSDNAQNDDPNYDRYATPEDVVVVTDIDAWYEWDLINAVTHWTDGDWNNEGVLMTALVETGNNRRLFHSSETTVSQMLRPTLVITYEPPEIGIADALPRPPVAARLAAAYPNPFAVTTTIGYELTEPARVRLRIFDVQGRMLRVLYDGARMSGRFDAVWDGLGESGARAASGVYFYRLEAGSGVAETRKVVVAN